jgi:hypothetical protein
MQNLDHDIGFGEKRQIFRRKLSKIAENCDHNIEPRSSQFSPVGSLFTFDSFYENLRSRPNFWDPFFHVKGYVLIVSKMGWAALWANFFYKITRSP